MKKNGVFLFLYLLLFQIYSDKFSLLCKLGTDDVTRTCVCGNQNTKSRTSLERLGQCNGYLACIFNHMKYIKWYII